MEGITSEAASLAGHLKLGKLIYLYDDNHISIDGSTDIAFTEDRGARFAAYGWQVQHVDDGNDVEAIDAAIKSAKKDPRPSLIVCRTHIGFGLPTRQDTSKAHGEPPGDEELDGAKEKLGWPKEPRFFIPEDVLAFFRTGGGARPRTGSRMAHAPESLPGLFPAKTRRIGTPSGRASCPQDWESALPVFPADEKGMATRIASGKVINALAAKIPELRRRLGGPGTFHQNLDGWLPGF